MNKKEYLWELWCSFAEDGTLVIAPIILGLYVLLFKSDIVSTVNDEFIVVLVGSYSIIFGLTQAMRLPKTIMTLWKRTAFKMSDETFNSILQIVAIVGVLIFTVTYLFVTLQKLGWIQ